MSGICGIYHRDGRPVDQALIARMNDVAGFRGPDGGETWSNAGLGLGHQRLVTTREFRCAHQPLHRAEADLSITFHGRIDDRRTLSDALGLSPNEVTRRSDADLVLDAYEHWGRDCPRHLVGDFAFALWDGRARGLLCARDILGVKPFWYATDTRRFVFGSEVRQVLLAPGIDATPDEGFVAELLIDRVTSKRDTLYRGVKRLPPAHTLWVDCGGDHLERYWGLGSIRDVRYRRDEEYIEHLSALFREVVTEHLESPAPVGAQLSGGVDSSSVVGLAMALRSELPGLPSVLPFSLVFPGRACDESQYIQQVAQRWGFTPRTFEPSPPSLSHHTAQIAEYGYLPDVPNGSMSAPIRRAARQEGCRVVLSGLGGDEWFWGSRLRYADQLRRGAVLTLLRQSLSDHHLAHPPWHRLARALRIAVPPLLPSALQQRLRQTLGRFRGEGFPDWIPEDFIRRVGLRQRLAPPMESASSPDLSRPWHYRHATSGWQSMMMEYEERAAARFGYELRHPFDDRRIVEFGLGLPDDLRWRQGERKWILRQANLENLPRQVARRTDKADFGHVFPEWLLAMGGHKVFTSMSISEVGWVNEPRLRNAWRTTLRRYRRGDSASFRWIWQIWHAATIELWYNSMQADEHYSR
jgi:asparagine synthase (glutamine-hydrolysing)